MSSHLLSILVLLSFSANADTNTSANSFEDYIDEKQKIFSKKVLDWSENIDKGLSRWLNKSDNNSKKCETEECIAKENEIDTFFKNDKFINETQKTFLNIRLGTLLESKEPTSYYYKIKAQLPLSRTKKNIKLFIDTVKENYFDTEEDDTPGIGINYFAKEFHGIDSRYSIGIRGLSAYTRARYSRDFEITKWLIRPTQQFQYSTRYDLSEETNIYFDRALEDFSLFRFTLHRKTQSHVDGFNYAASFSYFYTPTKTKGLSLSQSFWGNSKYKYIIDDTTLPIILSKPYAGISNYTTTLSWRQNIWRKWFVYEIQPAISFHRKYEYEPNYMLRFYIDFYFGDSI